MRHALAHYTAETEDEESARQRMLEFLECGANQFDRSNLQKHFTGSGLLIDPENNLVLLNYHKFLDMWVCFGGHADGEADLFNVALRETIEESGIEDVAPVDGEVFDVDIHPIPFRPEKNEPEHEHFDVLYLFQSSKDAKAEASSESQDIRWCDYETAKKLAWKDRRMQRILDKWKRKMRF